MKNIGQLHLAFFSHSRSEKVLSFDGGTYEIVLKTIIASCCVRGNTLYATTLQSDNLQSDKIWAKTSAKLLQKSYHKEVIDRYSHCGIIPPAKRILFTEP